MYLSLSTACFYHFPLRTVFALAAGAGFEGVELVTGPEVWLRGTRYVRSLASECGIPILSVHQTLLGLSPHGGGVGRIVEAVDVAAQLGCSCVVIHAPNHVPWSRLEGQRWMRTVRRCRERAVRNGVRLALETPGIFPTADGSQGEVEGFSQFVQRHDLDITLDTCHLGSAGIDLMDAYASLRERVVNVHFSDLLSLSSPLLFGPLRHVLGHHRMPGEGGLPLNELVARLTADDYRGALTVEASPIALRAWSLAKSRRRLEQVSHSLHFARDITDSRSDPLR